MRKRGVRNNTLAAGNAFLPSLATASRNSMYTFEYMLTYMFNSARERLASRHVRS